MSTVQPIDFSENYRDAWLEYRRLRKLCLLVWLGGLPGVFILSYPASWLSPRVSAVWFVILFLCWGIAFFRLTYLFQQFSCPRCGEDFEKSRFVHYGWLARKCGICGLKKFDVPPIEEQQWRTAPR